MEYKVEGLQDDTIIGGSSLVSYGYCGAGRLSCEQGDGEADDPARYCCGSTSREAATMTQGRREYCTCQGNCVHDGMVAGKMIMTRCGEHLFAIVLTLCLFRVGDYLLGRDFAARSAMAIIMWYSKDYGLLFFATGSDNADRRSSRGSLDMVEPDGSTREPGR